MNVWFQLFSRAQYLLVACLVGALAVGCSKTQEPPTFAETDLPEESQLRDSIDEILAHAKQTRHLRAGHDSAWQLVHGILAYGRDYKVDLDGQLVPAMQWLLDGAQLPGGGHLNGWRLEPADRGVRAIMEPGTMTGQGHPDQWLGYLSQAGLRLNERLHVAGRDYTVQDLLNQAQWDIQPGTEATWTLMALITYLPLDAEWDSRDGTHWTLEKLVTREAEDDYKNASCGGCHRLYALSLSVNRYMREKGITEDQLPEGSGWKKANDRVLEAVQIARQFQQSDGSFSTNHFQRPGTSHELEKQIGSTGHILEVLSVSLTEQQIREPWVTAAASRLVDLLNVTRDVPLNAGSLYHATHSLQIYRDRRFGAASPVSAVSQF